MKSLSELDAAGKTILVRVDYNVPIGDDGTIEDDTRIKETLPTLQFLLKRGARVVLLSHLGRPNGKPNPNDSLEPVALRLEKILGKKVFFIKECIGPDVKDAVSKLKPGEIALLENLRFHPEEEKNDRHFAEELASLGQGFVEDAFGVVHRAHASTTGIPKFLPSAAGFLLEEEIKILSELRSNPAHPYIAILGGAKVSDKIAVFADLLPKVDALLIGGGMAFTFLKAQGIDVGRSIVEENYLENAKKMVAEYPGKIFLPVDCKAAPSMERPDPVSVFSIGRDSMKGLCGLDIGPETIRRFIQVLEEKKPKTIFSNGPMGVFEIAQFSDGTRKLIEAIVACAEKGTKAIFGGGDMVAAFQKFGRSNPNIHLSTGGGAALLFLEGKTLPGIAALCETAVR